MLLEFAYFEIQWWHFLVFWGTVGALVRVWRLRTPLLTIARKKTWLAIAKGSGLPASRWRDFLGILLSVVAAFARSGIFVGGVAWLSYEVITWAFDAL